MEERSDDNLWYISHYRFLTKNLTFLKYGLRNSIMAIFGEKTFPIATNKHGDVTIAAAEFGQVTSINLKSTRH